MFQPVKFDQAEAVKANGSNSQFFDGNTEQLVKIVQTDIKGAPKFKVGDKVYFGANPDIKTISEVGRDNDVELDGEMGWASGDCCCPATKENYERLQATFPNIEFEQPPKPLFVE